MTFATPSSSCCTARRASSRGCCPRIAPAQLVVVDAGPDDGGARLARTARRERHRPPRQPGLRRRQQPRARARHAARDGPDEPGHDRLARTSWPAGRRRPACTPRGCSTRTAASSAAPTRSRARSAPSCPRVLRRSRPRRAEPHRADKPRTVGWAIAAVLAARTDTLRALGPFDPRIHLFAEDMDLCLRARAAGHPDDPAPRHRAHPHGPPQRRDRAVRAARPATARRDRAQAGRDARGASTTPPNCSRSPPGRRDQAPTTKESAPSWTRSLNEACDHGPQCL